MIHESRQSALADAIFRHDLSQPLTSAKLFLHLLAEAHTDDSQRVLLAHAMAALTAAERLLDAPTQTAAEALQPIALAPLLSELVDELRPYAAAKGLEIRLLPARVSVISQRPMLERILRNLLHNAITHTDRGRVLVGCRRRGAHTRIEIRDQGPGLAPADLPRVFAPYVRLRDNEAPGQGLGLASVLLAAEMLGHGVEVSSVLGRGACFAVVAAQATTAIPRSAACMPTPL